jgi:hypothetical protein
LLCCLLGLQMLDYTPQYMGHSCLIHLCSFNICGISLMCLDVFLFVAIFITFIASAILPHDALSLR